MRPSGKSPKTGCPKAAEDSGITKRDIIVVGTSAGGVEALQRLTGGLPRHLPAAVFVVMHLPPYRRSELPHLLSRDGRMPAVHPKNDQKFEHGRIYVAPPDFHLVIEPNDTVQLWRGPKENNFRPAINALFRSAAVAYRERVIGVILSGSLEEGVTGLLWVKKLGGLALVQEPNDADFGELPQKALEHVPADYVATADELGPILVQLTNGILPDQLGPDHQDIRHGEVD